MQNKCGSYLDDCHISPQCRWRSPARSQLNAQQPRARHASLGCPRPQPALRAALSIFPSRLRESSIGWQLFNGQQIFQQCPFHSAKVHQKGRRPATPQVYQPVKFHRPASTHAGDIAYKNLADKRTANDIPPPCLSVLRG